MSLPRGRILFSFISVMMHYEVWVVMKHESLGSGFRLVCHIYLQNSHTLVLPLS